MKGSILWKLIFTAVVLAWALLSLMPIQSTRFEEFITTRATQNKEEFNLLLERAHERVNTGTDQTLYLSLRNLASEEEIDLHGLYFPDINLIDIRNLGRRNEVLMSVLLKESQGKLKQGLDLQGGVAFTLSVNDKARGGVTETHLDKAIEIMGSRVNGLGVAEPIIRAIPPNSIEVQLPGLNLQDNPDAASILQKPARLEFREVHRYLSPRADERAGSIVTLPVNPQDSNSAIAAYEVMVLEREDHDTGQILESRYYVKRIPEATGDIIARATPTLDSVGRWAIAVSMTSDGSNVFADITRRMNQEDQSLRPMGRRAELATVLDGKLYSAVGLNDGPILDGRAQITGDFTQREAFELSNVLNNPLEFELVLEEMYEVGPSLASDARDASINAALWGAGVVIIMMLLYYRFAGAISVVSVVLCILIVIGVLASIGATLTLPGIAALILTIGMAVDANILIFERIREEQKAGKTPQFALKAGYEKALSTILDANITTLITALILIFFGRESVKGFGVTLAIGIAASVFAALIISQALLEIRIRIAPQGKLVPDSPLKPFQWNFLKHSKPAFIASWIVMLAGLAVVVAHRDHILGIDFRGGSAITLQFNPDSRDQLTVGNILTLAEQKNLGEIQAVFQKPLGDAQERLFVQLDSDENRPDQMLTALNEAFPSAGFKEISRTIVGATVGSSVQWNAVISVLIALGGILLYVALRFEFGYGIGAVVALAHDVLMSVGIYVVLGQVFGIGSGQFSAPLVAAILMIIGYSINDKIIVFDRVREELELNPDKNLYSIINLSINRTLSRTVLTGATTLGASIALWVFGEGIVSDFAFIFTLGVTIGTFSSLFIASPVFYWWHKGDRKRVTDREMARPTYEWETPGSSRSSARKPSNT